MAIIEILMGWLISTSLKGSLLVGIILLLKALFEKKIDARGHYYLWLLLIIRLMMPFSPPSQVSVFNLFNLNPGNLALTKNSGFITEGQALNLFLTESILDKFMFTGGFLPNLYFWLMVIWLIGVIVFSILIIKINFSFYTSLKSNLHRASAEILHLLEECKASLKIHQDIDILFSEAVDSPALCGLRKTRIVLPAKMINRLNSEEYRHIFLHELAHFKRKDITLFYLISLIQIVHWFNPVIWFGFNKMRQDCEIACDDVGTK